MAKGYLNLPLEDVMGDRFARYSKYIIQDRALPDVRDGLKPVQRRILFAMYKAGKTFDKNFHKSAKTVGTVIGNYHPHGDTSVYDAMVRLSQDWKMNIPLIEMHGNNGSIDGDPAAAMRYTEARLAEISSLLLKDIEKETVDHIYNFDDTNLEPTVLPAKFPNLLVNGSTGISAGYATDIPPHNLNEVIDACILQMKNPQCTTADLMKVIKGPDFPTGGIVQGKKGIKQAFETGKGRIIVRAKTKIEKLNNNREKIIIEEIPYDVNKANLIKRIDELRIERIVEGISEVRDETDRDGLRIVIELRANADSEGILNYLFKNTNLQITYHYNMVGIQQKTPKLLSLKQILDAYIEHQKEVLTRQTKFDLQKLKDRSHIVDGLIKAISIVDELIQLIRSSKNKQDAKENIKQEYNFTEQQAESIVTLQLYRLTNTDIQALKEEKEELKQKIKKLESILSSEAKLLKTIQTELLQIKKQYSMERLTTIEKEIDELEVDIHVTVPSEDVYVTVTNEGYIKRTSIRSYRASNGEELPLKESDHLIGFYNMNTTDELLLFTNKGNYVKLPVHKLPNIRWKQPAQHLSNLTELAQDELIIQAIPYPKNKDNYYLTFFTKSGFIKRSKLIEYNSRRFNRMLIAIQLQEDDKLLSVHLTNGKKEIFVVSNVGNALRYDEKDINPVGVRARGVQSMSLKDNEHVVNGFTFSKEDAKDIYVLTQRLAHKKMNLNDFSKQSRTNRGQSILRTLKTNPHYIQAMFLIENNDTITIDLQDDERIDIHMKDLNYSERVSNGSFLKKDYENKVIENAFIKQNLNKFIDARKD